jgi:hypothetical protein
MQDKESKGPVNRLEIAFSVVFLTVAAIALYLFGVKWVLSRDWYFPWRIIPYRLSAVIVLCLDVTWIIGVKKWWRLKDTYMKVILTLLVFVLSAIVLTDLLVIYAGNKMR